MKGVIKIILLASFCLVFTIGNLQAQHSIEVQKAQLNNDNWKALILFEKMPKRVSTKEAVISAGKSAWALGLVEKASILFDKALMEDNLDIETKADLLLSRGLIEYQEDNFEVAILFAKKASELFKSSHPFRGRAYLLWAESLYAKNALGAAESIYRNALSEIDSESINEVNYLLGRCLLKNGKYDEAELSFAEIPFDNERAPEVIKYLAEISFDREDYKQVIILLSAGRKNYKNKFLDAWVDYVLGVSEINENNLAKAKAIQAEANKIYPPSDYWLTLLNTKIEAAMYKRRNPELEG